MERDMEREWEWMKEAIQDHVSSDSRAFELIQSNGCKPLQPWMMDEDDASHLCYTQRAT